MPGFAIADDPRSVAWREFLVHARAAMVPAGADVWAPDGTSRLDLTAPLPPGKRIVRLLPTLPEEEPIASGRTTTERVWYAPIIVQVDTRTSGNDATSGLNLWGQLIDYLATDSVRLAFRRAGISDWSAGRAAASPLPDDVSTGTITLEVYLYR